MRTFNANPHSASGNTKSKQRAVSFRSLIFNNCDSGVATTRLKDKLATEELMWLHRKEEATVFLN